MELNNAFTAGTKGINLAGDPAQSMAHVPSNEDWQMLVAVTRVTEGVVYGHKIWGATKEYSAVMKYRGQAGNVPDNAVEIGQTVLFSRAGDFANHGADGFELHQEDAAKTSWVCLLDPPGMIYIQDLTEGMGRQVIYENGAFTVPVWSETLPVQTLDPASNFHNSAFPEKAGRIYAGKKITASDGSKFYLCYLAGVGEMETEFSVPINNYTLKLQIDSAGAVLYFGQ